jgi:predicted transcriptional regulator
LRTDFALAFTRRSTGRQQAAEIKVAKVKPKTYEY